MTLASSTDKQELLQQAIGPACHELRSPLAVVYGFARMLEGNTDLDATTAKYVAQIVRASERLDSMLDDLSKIGRISAGRTNGQIEQVSVAGIVEALASNARNEGRLIIDRGPDVNVKADPQWLTESLQAVIDGLCFEEGLDVRLSWRHEPHDVHIQFVPNSSFPMVDVEPEKSSLGISLARMRVVAMGGIFEGGGDRVVVVMPRG
ncbi:MAG: integral rane sensor hybrid histidine kinase [Thermoleophilia bacterium]|nr:integral rane sensor hybrid histidine kinase [Thermoleophilia bacterium]